MKWERICTRRGEDLLRFYLPLRGNSIIYGKAESRSMGYSYHKLPYQTIKPRRAAIDPRCRSRPFFWEMSNTSGQGYSRWQPILIIEGSSHTS